MSILEEAQKLVDGDRKEDYGDMITNFTLIANLWTNYLGHSIVLNAHDVAMLMILLKVARAHNGGLKKDTYIDIAGYAYCIDKMYLNSGDKPNE